MGVPSPQSRSASIFPALALFAFVGVSALVASLALLLYRTPLGILKEIFSSYQLYQIFFCQVGSVGPWHFHILFYTFFAILSWILYFLASFRPTMFHKDKQAVSPTRLISHLALLLASLIFIMQAFHHLHIFGNEHKFFAGRSLDEKLTIVHEGTPYLYAKLVHQTLPYGKFRGVFISDGNLGTEPLMGEHRRLAYFLYPTVDIRNVRPSDAVDCLIYYRKNNAREFVPDNFVIIGDYGSEFLLAIDRKWLK